MTTDKQANRDARRSSIAQNDSLNPIQMFAIIAGIVVIITISVWIAPAFSRDFLWMIP
jgi:hypothetical protein